MQTQANEIAWRLNFHQARSRKHDPTDLQLTPTVQVSKSNYNEVMNYNNRIASMLDCYQCYKQSYKLQATTKDIST